MIKLCLIWSFERAINKVLTFNPHSIELLSPHDGKVIKLEITDIKQQIYFIIRQTKIYVYTSYDHPCDASIYGTSFALLKQAKRSVLGKKVRIEGDIELVQAIKLLMLNFEFNWEEYLSLLIGDFAANQFTQIYRQIKHSVAIVKRRTFEDLVEFIHEEKRFLPIREEVEDFYEDNLKLRLKIDRIEARYRRILEAHYRRITGKS